MLDGRDMNEDLNRRKMTDEELIGAFKEEYGWSGFIMEGELLLDDSFERALSELGGDWDRAVVNVPQMTVHPQQKISVDVSYPTTYRGVDKEASGSGETASWQDWVLDPSKERGVLGLLLDVAECAVIGGIGVVSWVRGMVVSTYMGRSERNGRAE